MAQISIPGVLGLQLLAAPVADGTSALAPSPVPGTVGMDPAVAGTTPSTTPTNPPTATDAGTAAPSAEAKDEAIESLNLEDVAKKAAYELKKKHPSVAFTSGRRNKEEQASAMAGNVVSNRKWIEETYSKTAVRDACQKWVDDNPEKKTKDEIAKGLTEIFNKYTEAQLGVLSKHISGMAFDVQPVEKDAVEIKKTIEELVKGKGKFLEKEGGLVRWHAQFD